MCVLNCSAQLLACVGQAQISSFATLRCLVVADDTCADYVCVELDACLIGY